MVVAATKALSLNSKGWDLQGHPSTRLPLGFLLSALDSRPVFKQVLSQFTMSLHFQPDAAEVR
jgi:hypothetical protein